MYELTRIIAEFATEAEAQVALARLRLEEIRAFLVGHVPSAASFSMFGRLQFAPIQLVAATSQADRAKFVLAAAGVEVLENDWETLAELEVDGWLCGLCDSEVSYDECICPQCGTNRHEMVRDSQGDDTEEGERESCSA